MSDTSEPSPPGFNYTEPKVEQEQASTQFPQFPHYKLETNRQLSNAELTELFMKLDIHVDENTYAKLSPLLQSQFKKVD